MFISMLDFLTAPGLAELAHASAVASLTWRKDLRLASYNKFGIPLSGDLIDTTYHRRTPGSASRWHLLRLPKDDARYQSPHAEFERPCHGGEVYRVGNLHWLMSKDAMQDRLMNCGHAMAECHESRLSENALVLVGSCILPS